MDHASIQWVQAEIDKALQTARFGLEEFVEGSGEAATMAECADALHGVHGVLQMLEVYGVSLLLDEMELLARALGDRRVERQDEASEVLMRAILRLPGYLDYLRTGGQDNPLVLMPLLNDLRSVRGEPLLSENALFSPDLGAPLPLPTKRPAYASAGLSTFVRRLRPYFQKGLVGWFRGQDRSVGLDLVKAVLEHLEGVSGNLPMARLWWVASAAVEGLVDGGLESSVTLKRLIGQIDRQLRALVEDGAEVLDRPPPRDLLKNLLYYVAQAQSAGPRVRAAQEAFDLRELLRPTREAGEGGLAPPDLDAMQTVAAVLKEDLARVKDALDTFVRNESTPVERLAPIADTLRQVADTLGLLSLGVPRKAVMEQAALIRELVQGQTAPSHEQLMEIARVVLGVDAHLDALAQQGAEEPAAPDAAAAEPDAGATRLSGIEWLQLVTRVIGEAKRELAAVRDAIAAFIEEPGEHARLDEVPERVRQVEGSLRMLTLPRAAELLHRWNGYVCRELLDARRVPPPAACDALADSVVGIEYYLECVAEVRAEAEGVLDAVEQSLIDLAAIPAAPAPAEPAPPVEPPPAEAPPAERTPLPEAVEDALSAGAEPPPQAAPAAPSPVPVVPEPPAAAPDEAPAPAAPKRVIPEEVDEEILEVFIEEAGEVGEALAEYLPRWSREPEDREALVTVRRCFHTLKGSGRLVGATDLGEFAWAVENLLNRVIDGVVSPRPTVIELVEDAAHALPGLVEELRGGPASGVDIEELARRAESLARMERSQQGEAETGAPGGAEAGGEPEAPAAPGAPPTPPSEPSAEKKTEFSAAGELTGPAPGPSTALREVFEREAREHLAVLSSCLARQDAEPGGSCHHLMRVFHTLRGSARTAGAADLSELCAAVEACLIQRAEWSRPPDQTLLDVLRACEEPLRTAVADVAAGGPGGIERKAELIARIEALAASLPAPPAAAPAPPAAEPAAVQADPIAELRDLFFGEAEEILGACEGHLARWRAQRDDGAALTELERELHSLGGGARMAQFPAIDELAAELEALVVALRAGTVAGGDAALALLEAAQARLRELLGEARSGTRAGGGDPLAQRIRALLVGAAADTEDADEQTWTAAGEREELRGIFLDEAAEILESCDAALRRWSADRDGAPALTPLQRELHTLKGGARMAGIEAVGDLAHALEAVLERVSAGQMPPSAALLDLVQACVDRVAEMLDAVRGGAQAAPAADLAARIAALTEQSGAADLAPVAAQDAGVGTFSSTLEREDLRAVFFEEAAEILETSDELLRHLRATPGDAQVLRELQRELHTLKGGARMAGVLPLGDLAHSLESLLLMVSDGFLAATPRLLGTAQAALDRLAAVLDAERAGQPGGSVDELIDRIDALVSPGLQQFSAPEHPAPAGAPESAPAPVAAREAAEPAAARSARERIQVDSALIDAMVGHAGEISISQSRIEQQVGSFKHNLVEMDQTINRLRDQLRRLEIETESQILFRYESAGGEAGTEDFDPLELDRFSRMQQLSRGLMESVSDLTSIETILSEVTQESEAILVQQGRVNTELQEGLMRTRMLPFARQVPRFSRIVRQTARALGKRAELAVEGDAIALDRTIINRMVAPLEHMLRNALDHGIETPEARAAAGKPEMGRLRIELSRDGNEVLMVVRDDGRGMNRSAIRTKAIQRGLMKADADLTDDELYQFVLEPAFSTADEITQISGRGLGMDVVSNEIRQLGGSLRIESTPGAGAAFHVRLPLTLAINQALMAQVGDETFAVPLSNVEAVARLAYADCAALQEQATPHYEHLGQRYRFARLGALLGLGEPPLSPEARRYPAVLVRAGEHRMALLVDALAGRSEVVVKPVGPQLSSIRWLTGATILGDGRVVLILDMPALVRMGVALHGVRRVSEGAEGASAARAPTVMVVDDSITVRKVTARFLTRNGLQVLTARDGLDALALLQESRPDLILLDVEMPRMDGFELATTIRNDQQLRDLPIIMITSRTGRKHSDRAEQIGVNRYLGKPYHEAELLEHINALLERRA